MRRIARSMARFSWATSLLGCQQLAAVLPFSGPTPGRPDRERAAAAFDALADVAEEHLGQTCRMAFRTGDRVLHRAIDMVFDAAPLSAGSGSSCDCRSVDLGEERE